MYLYVYSKYAYTHNNIYNTPIVFRLKKKRCSSRDDDLDAGTSVSAQYFGLFLSKTLSHVFSAIHYYYYYETSRSFIRVFIYIYTYVQSLDSRHSRIMLRSLANVNHM